MPDLSTLSSLARVPAVPHAVGVSGGADSTALLLLVRHHRPDVPLHVVHLNHETRGDASDGDAAFVQELAGRLDLPFTLARRRDVEPLLTSPPTNPSAFYRALRHRLFADTVDRHGLTGGVLLAHHALDQAETVVHRLLRNAGPAGLAGMAESIQLRLSPGRPLTLRRPLLSVAPDALRAYLTSLGQPWREDASNQSPAYLRNRLRQTLLANPDLVGPLLELARSASSLRQWLRTATPVLGDAFDLATLADLPDLLAAESARRYLSAAGSPPDDLTPAVLARLVTMARDAASPPRQHFPGKVLVRRRKGTISRA